jgi:aspartate/methionine/tyrosine aminotransferase
MPPEITAFARPEGKRIFPRRADVIDLASFRWPIEIGDDQLPGAAGLNPATEEQLGGLKEELCGWFSREYGIKLIPDKEVFIGGSIRRLVFQLCLAYVDTGDVAFVPAVGIPLYRSAVVACDGEAIGYGISEKSDWRPRFERLSTRLGRVARLLFLNSPHNPTGIELAEKEMADLAWLASKENVLVVNDAAYGGLSSRPPVSLLAAQGGKKVGVELGSFAYRFGLPAIPFGFAVGNRDAISGLKRIARLLPSHLPAYYVDLALQAIRKYPGDGIQSLRDRVSRASAAANELLDLLGLESVGLPTVPYVWARAAKRAPSTNLAKTILRRYKFMIAPGLGFGENGEGFVRLSLLAGPEAYSKAADRVRKGRAARLRGKK